MIAAKMNANNAPCWPPINPPITTKPKVKRVKKNIVRKVFILWPYKEFYWVDIKPSKPDCNLCNQKIKGFQEN